jgi:hypothetical protein
MRSFKTHVRVEDSFRIEIKNSKTANPLLKLLILMIFSKRFNNNM